MDQPAAVAAAPLAHAIEITLRYPAEGCGGPCRRRPPAAAPPSLRSAGPAGATTTSVSGSPTVMVRENSPKGNRVESRKGPN